MSREESAPQAETQDDRSFEECLQSLEKVVERIESGELSLEDSLATFEEGVRLVQSCNRKLSDVERRIEVLTKDSEGRTRLRELVEEEALD
ncbi:MAG: exodeoxyribonuclease VII small subunit [Deltaproteobacteria bacterium]|nr:exodeoxyribonuclease VII small subunit [Deltaproteobacteria bacterium]